MAGKVFFLGETNEGRREYNVRPTLVIGLGGSGKEVLLRLRRLFYERHRRVGLPITRYLWIDTDIRDINIRGVAWDDLEPAARLRPEEQIDLRVMPEQLDELYRNKGAYPHIFGWFPSAQIQKLGNYVILQGTGMIRALGRLALHVHAKRLLEVFGARGREAGLREEVIRTQELGYRVDEDILEVIVLGSLGGGTGSGVFIDVGFMIKHLYPDAIITGAFFMPGVFEASPEIPSDLKRYIKANGYASLMELDTYLSPVIGKMPTGQENSYANMTFRWTGDEYPVPCPPFSTVYLIDHEGEEGAAATDYTEAFQMVAEFLLFDQEQSDFSTRKRSNRSNQEQGLHRLTGYKVEAAEQGDEAVDFTRFYPNRYSTFGLAQIIVNRLRLANAAAYLAASEVCRLWLGDDIVVAPHYVTAELLSDDPNHPGWFRQRGWNIDALVRKVLRSQGDQTFVDRGLRQLEDALNPVRANLLQLAEQSGIAAARPQEVWGRAMAELDDLSNRISDKVENQALFQGSRRSRGSEIQQIEAQGPVLEAEMKTAAEETMIELLASAADRGPLYARVFLKQLLARLEDLLAKARAELASDPAPLPEARSEPGVLRRLVAARDLPAFPPPFKKKAQQLITKELLEHVQQVQHDVEERLRAWIRDKYRRAGLGVVVEVLQHIVNTVGEEVRKVGRAGAVTIEHFGLRRQLESYVKGVQSLRGKFEKLHQAFARTPIQGRNHYLSPEVNWVPEIEEYLEEHRSWPKPLGVQIVELSEDFFRQGELLRSGVVTNVRVNVLFDGIREVVERAFRGDVQEWRAVEQTLEHHCLEVFGRFLATTDSSAVKLFQRQIPQREWPVIISRVAQSAWPRLRRSEILSSQEIASIKGLIGFAPSDPDFAKTVREDSGGHSMSSNRVLTSVESGEEDAIVFFTEKVAFPTLSIGGLRTLREAYVSMLKEPDEIYHRHTDREISRFRDILPPADADSAQREVEAYEPFIEALVIGAVTYKPNLGFVWEHRNNQGMVVAKVLGSNIDQSVAYLAGDGDSLRDELRNYVDSVYARWKRENAGMPPQDQPFVRMAALYAYHLTNAFARHQVTVQGRRHDVDNMVREIIAKRLLTRARSEAFRVLGAAADELNMLMHMTPANGTARWHDLNQYQDSLSNPPEIDRFSVTIQYREPGLDALLRQMRREVRDNTQ